MKKIVCIAVIAMSGIVLVSCDADGVESAAPQFNKKASEKEYYNLTSRTGDSIPVIDTLMTNIINPGPGDDPIPVPPPPPPKNP